jgi:hypothetical protein
MSLDDDLDRLYQLPLDEFTAARNDVAKRAGARAADVKKLTKPPIAAWAVNQLYWKDRKTYDALIEAAGELRAAHKAVLSGKRGDLRFAGKEHEDAIEKALKATLAILVGSGHPVTDATRHAIAQTLRALPADDPAGRLSRALQPGGFEMLAGITVKGGGAGARAVTPALERGPSAGLRAGPSTGRKPSAKHQKPEPDDRKLAEAREDATSAARALREAEQTARRLEFEAARAARAAAKADEGLTDARANLEAARKQLEDANTEATAAARKDHAAKRATEAAERDLASARKRAEAADKALARLAPRS